MVRILITGAAGGLGRALQERLAKPGLSLAPRYPGPVEVSAFTREQLDVARRDQVAQRIQEFRPDIVLSAAGQTHIDLCESYQWEAFLVNRDGSEHVARESHRLGALPVYFSTDLVFDGGKKQPYSEEDPPNPISVYADTKLAGELGMMSHAPRHLILRTGWLYGHSGKHFLRALQTGMTPGEILFGYDDHRAQPTLVDDFIEALFHLLRNDKTGTFHVANSGAGTQYEALREAVTMSGVTNVEVRPIQHAVGGRQAMRPSYSVLNCAKLEQAGHRMRPWPEALMEWMSVVRKSR